jgi:DNA polymerase IV
MEIGAGQINTDFSQIDSLPSDILVVNESYSIACTQSRRLFDAKQKLYAVKGSEATSEIQEPQPVTSQPSDESLQVKQRKSKKGGNIPQSPTRSQESMQGQLELPPGLWLSQAESEGEHQLDQSPRESSPAPNFQAPAKYGDELDAMIETARKLQYLPLDDGDDDDDSRPSSSDGPEDPVDLGSDDERAAAVAAKKKRKTTKGSFNQDNFSCMSGGTGITLESNPNRRTIEILQEMCEHYERTDNTWRYRAYRVAIGMLKKQSVLIANRDQAMDIRGIGTRLADKIVEIVTDGRLRRLEYAKQEPNDQILQIFLKVYGVGLSQANKWIQNGHKTLDDLKQKVDLTENQRTGIERYDDFNTRIPREEVTALGEVVKGVAETIDHKVEVIIGGSYRRGAPNSGDIDFILTKPRTTSSQELMPFLNSLIDRLTSTGFLVAPLAVSRNESGTKWHGACVLPGAPKQIWRRIDFLLVPESELGAALIYFTGDDIFNRSIRLLSSTKGMRLNQRGLYKDIMRGPGRVKFNEGALIEGADEKKIFDALGVPWRPPEHRICH